jgi:ketosteroid isomerase-like protein
MSFSCQPKAEQPLSSEERRAVADEVGQLFNQIPEVTNALDFERLLSYYRESEELTYVARGRVTRSFAAFSDVMDAQFGGVTEANLRWLDTYVHVLSREVVVATASFEFTATLESGDTAQSAGTYMAIYVLHDGQWRIEYTAHSFPVGGR